MLGHQLLQLLLLMISSTPVNATTHGHSGSVTVANQGGGSNYAATWYAGFPLKSNNPLKWFDAGNNTVAPFLQHASNTSLASEGNLHLECNC